MLGIRVVMLVLMAVGLASCGSNGDDREEPAPPPMTTSAAGAQCGRFPQGRAEQLAGQSLTTPRETRVGGILPACLWGSLDDVGVQAARLGSTTWARSLPDLVAVLRRSGSLDERNAAKLVEAANLVESGRDIPPSQACALFTDLIELNGVPAGSNLTVNLIPSAADPVALSAQACRGGTYASVTVARPDITGSATELRMMRRAVVALLG